MPALKVDPGTAASALTIATCEVAELHSFFEYRHLPAHLQAVSKRYSQLAHELCYDFEPSFALVDALRALLVSKDAAVRARQLEWERRPRSVVRDPPEEPDEPTV
jgi:hypothetical protein